MKFHWMNQRTMPYGTMSIVICTAEDDYTPTNEEVISLAREIFGVPADEILNKIEVRLYWKENIRIFEVISDEVYEQKRFRMPDYRVYNMMDSFQKAADDSGWIATAGSNRIDKIWGYTLVKVVE